MNTNLVHSEWTVDCFPGMSLPNSPSSQNQSSQDPNVLAYQANLHRAFLQSAMAQNFQIQQQLLAQNQALQQLLQQQAQTVSTQLNLYTFLIHSSLLNKRVPSFKAT